jgi:hypothetical protein
VAVHAVLLVAFIVAWRRSFSTAKNALSVSDLFEDQEAGREESEQEASLRDIEVCPFPANFPRGYTLGCSFVERCGICWCAHRELR